MGDMGELGDKSLEHHLSVFKLARDIDIKYFFTWVNIKMRQNQYLEIVAGL